MLVKINKLRRLTHLGPKQNLANVWVNIPWNKRKVYHKHITKFEDTKRDTETRAKQRVKATMFVTNLLILFFGPRTFNQFWIQDLVPAMLTLMLSVSLHTGSKQQNK